MLNRALKENRQQFEPDYALFPIQEIKALYLLKLKYDQMHQEIQMLRLEKLALLKKIDEISIHKKL